MMTMPRSLPALALTLALALALPLAACGGTARGGDSGPSTEQATIVVENNLNPPAAVTIHAVSSLGSRQRVGSVPPGSTRTLRVSAGSLVGQYRFIADAGLGRELVSVPLPLSGGETVRWELNTNTAVVQ